MFQLSFDKYLAEQQFKPSKYQQRIFEWIQFGSENSCVVGAVPGSGKTTTLIKGSHYVSVESQFLAVNKHIVQELKKKLPRHVVASTIHSLGFSSVKRKYPECQVSATKYNRIVSQYLNDRNVRSKQDLENLTELVRLVKLTLTDYTDLQQLINLVNYYSIPINGNWKFWQNAVDDILKIGIEKACFEVDFDDMIWIPNALGGKCTIPHSDFLFIDECQDLNQAQLQLVLKAHHQNTRSLFVGDPFQSIMGFSGADTHSIDHIINATNAIQLPLSISYRLPKSHIELANRVYNVIEAADNAIEGIIERGDYSDVPDAAEANDLIICRCFYPLVPIYFALLKLGKPAQIKNHDISKQLIGLLKQIFGEGRFNEHLTRIEFNRETDNYFRIKRDELLEKNETFLIIALEDKIETLRAIYQGAKCQSISELIIAINELTKPKNGNPINLTTIHGAKGLEADNVFVVRSDLMPHKLAKKDWELEQEKNLFFVSLTRAKSALYLC